MEIMKKLALHANARVFTPEYRLAPEDKFPTGFDDCYGVVLQVLSDTKQYGVASENYALVGDSAGGQIAIAVSYRLAQHGQTGAKLIAPIYPVTGNHILDFTPGQIKNSRHPIVGTRTVAQCNLAMLQYDVDREDYISILMDPYLLDRAWANEYAGYCNKYLPDYHENYKPIAIKEESTRHDLSADQKSFLQDYRNYMRDYRSSCVKMTDEYLEAYLEYGPSHHLYITAGHDILRDEAIVLYRRLQDLNKIEDTKFEHLD